MENHNHGKSTVHISNEKQYLETKIVRRYAVSDNSTMVTFRDKCFVCTVDFRLCEFGSCKRKWPFGVFS